MPHYSAHCFHFLGYFEMTERCSMFFSSEQVKAMTLVTTVAVVTDKIHDLSALKASIREAIDCHTSQRVLCIGVSPKHGKIICFLC